MGYRYNIYHRGNFLTVFSNFIDFLSHYQELIVFKYSCGLVKMRKSGVSYLLLKALSQSKEIIYSTSEIFYWLNQKSDSKKTITAFKKCCFVL